MSDPEILDPQRAAPTGDVGVERLLAEVQRALPGRAVRVEVDEAPGRATAFRLQAEGEGGSIVVENGPMYTVLVSFAGARFPFLVAPGANVDEVHREIACRVRSLAEERLVVHTRQATAGLRRTLVIAVDPPGEGGRIRGIVDTRVEPHAGDPAEPARFASFAGTWGREPTKAEQRALDKLQGGVVGKLKRKLLEKLFDKATDTIKSAFEQAGASAPDPHDGKGKLPGG